MEEIINQIQTFGKSKKFIFPPVLNKIKFAKVFKMTNFDQFT